MTDKGLAASVAGIVPESGIVQQVGSERVVWTDPEYSRETAAIALGEHGRVLVGLRSARNLEDVLGVAARHHNCLDRAFCERAKSPGCAIACRRGCGFCCHLRTDALPWEVFRLVHFIRRHLTPEQVKAVRDRADANQNATSMMSPAERWKVSLPCPLLQSNACLAYEARPAVCRMYHAKDVSLCERVFKDPKTEEWETSVPELRVRLMAVSCAADQAFAHEAYDTRPYDLSCALVEALDSPKCAKRWWKRKRAFSGESVTTVP